MLCNYKIIFKRGQKQLAGFGSFETNETVPAVLDGDPISVLVFKKRTSFDSSFLDVPRILSSAQLEEFF